MGTCLSVGTLLYTCASTVKVGVAVVAIGALAAVSDTIGGVDAIAVGAPAPVVRPVALGDVAVGDVPDGPVEHDGDGEVVGPVEVGAVPVGGVDPPVLHHERVPARSRVLAEDSPLGFLEALNGRLVVGDIGWYPALAAPNAGARRRRHGVPLRRSADGRAAGDVVARVVAEVAEVGAAERDEAVPRGGYAVGVAAKEGQVHRVVTGVVADVALVAAVALAEHVDESYGLAVGDGQAGQIQPAPGQDRCRRGEWREEGEARREVAVVAEELVAEVAGADAEGVGNADVAAPVGAARQWLTRRWSHRRQGDD
ncbi:hypothetical protein EE612_014359 [Oryza sativa]|nr:hypothetical protein EE612_014359 [Oryza sativa]